MNFYSGKRVAVTGANGFLAHNLIHQLSSAGARVIGIGRGEPSALLPSDMVYHQTDLTCQDAVTESFKDTDYVFHLAATGGGFHQNLSMRPQILTQNLIVNSNCLEGARRAGVKRYLFTSSFSVYPPSTGELTENVPWSADPATGESPLGWAKRVGEKQAEEYHKAYDLPVAIVRPCNPYGPFDHFDSQTGHVVPALIKRVLEGENPLVVRGSGKPVRSFIYAPDAVRAMMLALEHQAKGNPVNLAVPESTSIESLAKKILVACGRQAGDFQCDKSFADGPAVRLAGSKKAVELLGHEQFTSLNEGIKKTVSWYCSQHKLMTENSHV